MARSFHRKQRLTAVTEINVTPLIDLAFALLIIFMITTPLLEQTIPLDLPEESQKPQVSSAEEAYQVVSVTVQGAYFWGDRAVTVDELEELLRSLAQQGNPPAVHVRADGQGLVQNFVTVLDLLKKYDLNKLYIDTKVKG